MIPSEAIIESINGKLTISMAMFTNYVTIHQMVTIMKFVILHHLTIRKCEINPYTIMKHEIIEII